MTPRQGEIVFLNSLPNIDPEFTEESAPQVREAIDPNLFVYFAMSDIPSISKDNLAFRYNPTDDLDNLGRKVKSGVISNVEVNRFTRPKSLEDLTWYEIQDLARSTTEEGLDATWYSHTFLIEGIRRMLARERYHGGNTIHQGKFLHDYPFVTGRNFEALANRLNLDQDAKETSNLESSLKDFDKYRRGLAGIKNYTVLAIPNCLINNPQYNSVLNLVNTNLMKAGVMKLYRLNISKNNSAVHDIVSKRRTQNFDKIRYGTTSRVLPSVEAHMPYHIDPHTRQIVWTDPVAQARWESGEKPDSMRFGSLEERNAHAMTLNPRKPKS